MRWWRTRLPNVCAYRIAASPSARLSAIRTLDRPGLVMWPGVQTTRPLCTGVVWELCVVAAGATRHSASVAVTSDTLPSTEQRNSTHALQVRFSSPGNTRRGASLASARRGQRHGGAAAHGGAGG